MKALKSDTALKIYIAGHTDNKGTFNYNNDLSKWRAQAVGNELTSQYGITSDRLIPVGIGPAASVGTNKTEAGRTLNRRVELVERWFYTPEREESTIRPLRPLGF